MSTLPEQLDGMILLDKPAGLTSHDCVAEVRKMCPRKFKVGHGGTLDPFCTGLLILLTGKCTRLASYFQGMDKAYEGVIRFGESTDTFDCDGKVTATGELPRLDPEALQVLANRFVGQSMQKPPAFSAKRIGHVRAYELARRGESPDLAPVSVNVYEFSVSPLDERDLHFRLKCSSGTYVRALARDLGEAAGCPAHCYQLCRTEVGSFTVHQTNRLDAAFHEKGFIAFDQVNPGFPVHQANHREEKLLMVGQKIPAPRALVGHQEPVKILAPSGRFIALARLDGRQLQPAVVFPV